MIATMTLDEEWIDCAGDKSNGCNIDQWSDCNGDETDDYSNKDEYQANVHMMYQSESNKYCSINTNESYLWNHDNYQHNELKHIQSAPCATKVIVTEKASTDEESKISSSTRECDVCFVGKPKQEFYPIYSETCEHSRRYICNSCTYDSVKVILNSAMSSQMPCPEIDCSTKWDSHEIRRVLLVANDNLLLKKYDAYQIRQYLENDDKFFWCAHECGSGQYHYRRSTRNPKITCILCKKDTCAFHRIKWHEGMTCNQYDRFYPSRDAGTRKWIKRYSKKCPGCQSNIEKNGGCDHITCPKCRYQFCWDCLVDYAPFTNRSHVRHKISCKHHIIGKLVSPVRFLSLRRSQ
ncbi:unnamed protein product [Rotaria sordida]|uniref:RBR-type E3 ubiquitin transferase n=1 Tax=Rotaria sordida TaxID=392033 RepID=A0A814CIL5_9BILA|nr:unnamed protein product [Rotaria sordida]